MKLVERISQQNAATPAPFQRSLMGVGNGKRTVKDAQAEGFQQLKLAVHNRLFEMLDVTRLESLEPVLAAQKVTEAISAILDDEGRLLTDTDKTHLIEEIKNELLGLGPLEPLLWDDEITDILVNGHNQVYVEKRGKLHATEVKFQDDQHLMLIIDRIVSQVGRRVDEASPMVDARLPDGSRINAIIPPLALDGPSLSIRRFGRKRYNIDDLVEKKTDGARDRRVPAHHRARAPQHPGLRRHRLGQNHDAQLHVAVHPGRRANRDDRRLGRIDAPAAARGAGSKRGRPTSKARAKSASATW